MKKHTINIGGKSLQLVNCVGSYSKNTVCVMSAEVARWRHSRGEPIGKATDRLDCACPVLREALIVANNGDWWETNDERTDVLGRWIGHIAGTRDDTKMIGRMFGLVDAAVRIDAAGAMDMAGIKHELREIKRIVDIDTAKAANTAVDDAENTVSNCDVKDDVICTVYAACCATTFALNGETDDAVFYASQAAVIHCLAATTDDEKRYIRDGFLKRLADIYGISL